MQTSDAVKDHLSLLFYLLRFPVHYLLHISL